MHMHMVVNSLYSIIQYQVHVSAPHLVLALWMGSALIVVYDTFDSTLKIYTNISLMLQNTHVCEWKKRGFPLSSPCSYYINMRTVESNCMHEECIFFTTLILVTDLNFIVWCGSVPIIVYVHIQCTSLQEFQENRPATEQCLFQHKIGYL